MPAEGLVVEANYLTMSGMTQLAVNLVAASFNKFHNHLVIGISAGTVERVADHDLTAGINKRPARTDEERTVYAAPAAERGFVGAANLDQFAAVDDDQAAITRTKQEAVHIGHNATINQDQVIATRIPAEDLSRDIQRRTT